MKFKIRCIMKREPLLFHIILKQSLTCSHFQQSSRNSISQLRYPSRNGLQTESTMQLSIWILQVLPTGRCNRCGGYSKSPNGNPQLQKGLCHTVFNV